MHSPRIIGSYLVYGKNVTPHLRNQVRININFGFKVPYQSSFFGTHEKFRFTWMRLKSTKAAKSTHQRYVEGVNSALDADRFCISSSIDNSNIAKPSWYTLFTTESVRHLHPRGILNEIRDSPSPYGPELQGRKVIDHETTFTWTTKVTPTIIIHNTAFGHKQHPYILWGQTMSTEHRFLVYIRAISSFDTLAEYSSLSILRLPDTKSYAAATPINMFNCVL